MPPVLPVIRVVVRSDDEVEVSIDGQLLVSGPNRRANLGGVVSAIVNERGVPMRIELTESDGRQFADIILPEPARSQFAPPPVGHAPWAPPVAAPATPVPPAPAATPVGASTPIVYQIEGSGFIPGEDVGVAIIMRTTSADQYGLARALVDSREMPAGQLGVLLFGFISGTLAQEGTRR